MLHSVLWKDKDLCNLPELKHPLKACQAAFCRSQEVVIARSISLLLGWWKCLFECAIVSLLICARRDTRVKLCLGSDVCGKCSALRSARCRGESAQSSGGSLRHVSSNYNLSDACCVVLWRRRSVHWALGFRFKPTHWILALFRKRLEIICTYIILNKSHQRP